MSGWDTFDNLCYWGNKRLCEPGRTVRKHRAKDVPHNR